ncbi:hypothetical protein [Methanopyrus sp.]
MTATFLCDEHIVCKKGDRSVTVAAIANTLPYTRAGLLIDDVQFVERIPGIETAIKVMVEGTKGRGANVAYEGNAEMLSEFTERGLSLIITYRDDSDVANWPEPFEEKHLRGMMVINYSSIRVAMESSVLNWATKAFFTRTVVPKMCSLADLILSGSE